MPGSPHVTDPTRGRAAARSCARGSLAIAVLLAGGLARLNAQGTTGKIQGTVANAAGNPVAGAQVILRGTALGAIASSSGYYFINNVPAGTYTLFVVYVGLQPSEVRGVRILADQTLTVDVTLLNPVELGAITVSVEQNPIVPRDQVTTKSIVAGFLVDRQPVDDLQDILNLQPGVVESDRGLSLRGGRPGEAAVYVDGALVRNQMWGTPSLVVGTNTLEEASVTTGAIGVEYGDAQSGIIAFVTRAGGPTFSGNFSYETDEPFGKGSSIGFNRVEGSVGGPIVGALTFFVAGTLDGRQSDLMGKGFGDVPTYVLGGVDTTVSDLVIVKNDTTRIVDTVGARSIAVPRYLQWGGSCDAATNYGFACQGVRQPYNWSTTGTAQAKLQYTYGGGSRVAATYLMSREQGRVWGNAGILNPAFAPSLTRGYRFDSRMVALNWTQQVLRGAERNLSFDVSLSYQTDAEVRGLLATDAVTSSRSPFGGWSLNSLPFLVDFDHFSDDTPDMYRGVDSLVVTRLQSDRDWDQLVYNVRAGLGTRTPYLNRFELRNAQPYRLNPFGQATGFPTQGIDTWFRLEREQRYVGRAFLDWQVDRYNRVRFGGDAQVSRWRYTEGGYLAAASEASSERPVRYALFGEDRLDLGDVVIELGARWDYFDTGAYFQVSPGVTFTHPGFDPSDPLDPADSVFLRGTGHSRVSPRIRVSFPVTDRTGFRLSYAHQVQSPDLWTSLAYLNTRGLARDITFGRTILFEFGIRHAFSPDLVADISAYNKDKVSDFTTRKTQFIDPRDGSPYFAPTITNADFGNVRGVDVSLIRRIGDIVNAQVAYTLQIAKGTGADPWSSISSTLSGLNALTGEPTPPPQAIYTTDDNRIHTIAGAISITVPGDFGGGTWYGGILRDVGTFLRFRFASGLPYTALINAGAGTIGPYMGVVESADIMKGPTNSSRMSWTRELDLRLTKGVRLLGMQWTAFADIRNLFNFTDLRRIFAETGGPTNDEYRLRIVSPEVARLVAEAQEFAVEQRDGSIAVTLPDDCTLWGNGPVNCVALKRAEARFGNGDGLYTEPEYEAAFNAAYDQWRGTFFFYAPPRHARLGVELRF